MSHAPRSRRHYRQTLSAALLTLVAGLAAALISTSPAAATTPPMPGITSFTPNHGPAAGGNEIVVSGSMLDMLSVGSSSVGLGVYFGATRGTVVSATWSSAIVKVPAGLSGTTVDVSVAYSGSSAAEPTRSITDDYTYDGKTRRSLKLSPDHGSPLGGSTVTLTGLGVDFRNPRSVTFGGNAAEIESSTDTSVTVKTPAGTPSQRVAVSLTTAAGDVHGTQWTRFQYDWTTERPNITSMERGEGVYSAYITVNGSGFAGPTQVWIDGEPVYASVSDETKLVFAMPRLLPGTYDVTVRTLVGDSANTPADDLQVPPSDDAVLDEISPNHGPAAGGTVLTIRGKGFATATKVEFGNSVAGTNLEVISDTELRVTTPPFNDFYDSYDVRVTTAAGTLFGHPMWTRDDFNIDFAPGHLTLSPGHAPAGAPAEVVVTMDGVNPRHVASFWLLRSGEEPLWLTHSEDSATGTFKLTLPAAAPGETVRLQARAYDPSSWDGGAPLNGDGDPFRWDGNTTGTFAYSGTGQASLPTLVRKPFAVTSTAGLTFAADGSVRGPLALSDTTARLTSGGFLPITGVVGFVPSGTTSGTYGDDGLKLAGKYRVKLKDVKLFSFVPLLIGNSCQSKQLSTIAFAGPAFTPSAGGRLTSTFALSDLNGCFSLTGLMNPLTASTGNTLTLDLAPRG